MLASNTVKLFFLSEQTYFIHLYLRTVYKCLSQKSYSLNVFLSSKNTITRQKHLVQVTIQDCMSTFLWDDHHISVCCREALCMLPIVSLKTLKIKAFKGWNLIRLIIFTIIDIKWNRLFFFFFKTECKTRKNSVTTRIVWCQCFNLCQESEVTQSCPTLCSPMDCSLPGFSVHGIFQARVLERIAITLANLCQGISNFTYHCFCISNVNINSVQQENHILELCEHSLTCGLAVQDMKSCWNFRLGDVSPCFSKKKLSD